LYSTAALKKSRKQSPESSSSSNPARLDLQPFPEKGTPPPRVKDLKSLHSVYTRFLQDDEKSAYNRALVRDAADGAPPYEDESIEQEGRFNLNFHDLSGLLEERNATYTDLIDSTSELLRVYFPETLDEAGGSEREEKAAIIGEEFTQLVRHDWGEFYSNWDYLINELIQHGLSMGYFPDETTWKWKAAGMDDFLIARQCRASEDAVDVMFIRQKFPAHAFFSFIKDDKVAKGAGWNIEEARKALVEATSNSSGKGQSWGRYWNETIDELANNDFGSTYSKAVEVDCVHALVREFDGSYSHYIFKEDGKGESFLFQRRGRYPGNENLFTIFTSRVGRNGKYHSVRGDLWRAYPEAQALNRLRCAALDSTAHSMAILLQPVDAESMEDFALVLNGPVAWLPPEAQVIQQRSNPNLAQNALPMIQDLSSVMRTNLGLPGPQGEIKQANTKYGQIYEQLQAGSLTGAQVTRFYRAWRRLLTAQFRRIQAIGPVNSRYPEIETFFARLMLRGVTPEDFMAIERVEPYRAAGSGSVGARLRAYDGGMETIGMLDEVGRARFLRDFYGEKFGRDLSTQYVGRPQKPRFVIDARVAELENNALREDPNIVPMPGENDLVHAQTHLGRAAQDLQQVEQLLTQKGDVDPTPAMPVLQHIQAILQHTGPHIEAMAGDPTREAPFGELRKAFQQISARWQAMLELAQRLTPSEEAQQEQLTKLQMKQQEHQLKMQIMFEQHQAKAALKQQDVGQRMNLRKFQADTKLAMQLARGG
jgi:hypothetical protein